MPKERNITPRYEQKSFPLSERKNTLQTIVAPDNTEAVWINQNAWFTLGSFDAAATTSYTLHNAKSGVYVFVLKGDVTINGIALQERDGLGITEAEVLSITADADTEFLLMEVPM
jgi:redox-sensitive bicupin YhaK (pirin superfamily)